MSNEAWLTMEIEREGREREERARKRAEADAKRAEERAAWLAAEVAEEERLKAEIKARKAAEEAALKQAAEDYAPTMFGGSRKVLPPLESENVNILPEGSRRPPTTDFAQEHGSHFWDHTDDDLAWGRAGRAGAGDGGGMWAGWQDPEASQDPRGMVWWQEGRKVVTGRYQS